MFTRLEFPREQNYRPEQDVEVDSMEAFAWRPNKNPTVRHTLPFKRIGWSQPRSFDIHQFSNEQPTLEVISFRG